MIFSISLLLGIASVILVIMIWSYKRIRLQNLKQQVERQMIRKDSNTFNITEEIGLTKLLNYTQKILNMTGSKMDAEDGLIYIGVGNILLLAVGLFLELGPLALIIPLGFNGLLYWFAKRFGENRIVKLEHELKDTMSELASYLRQNDNLFNAINEILPRTSQPLREELKIFINEVNYGESEEIALKNFSQRNGSLIIEGWVETVIFAKQTGRDLADTCDRVSKRMREKIKVKGRIQAAAAGPKGTIIGLLVIGLIAFLGMASTVNIKEVFLSGRGLWVTSYVLGSLLGATLLTLNLIDKEVNS